MSSFPLVSRVIEYEPRAHRAPALPPVPAAQPATVPATTPSDPPPDPPPPPDPLAHAAATFADAALRRVLEVIERRRPLAQLRPLMSTGLVDSLLPLMAARPAGTARLRRVIAQPVGGRAEIGADDAAAEIAANYARGNRLHAIACRVQQTPGPIGPRWQVVALHLG